MVVQLHRTAGWRSWGEHTINDVLVGGWGGGFGKHRVFLTRTSCTSGGPGYVPWPVPPRVLAISAQYMHSLEKSTCIA